MLAKNIRFWLTEEADNPILRENELKEVEKIIGNKDNMIY